MSANIVKFIIQDNGEELTLPLDAAKKSGLVVELLDGEDKDLEIPVDLSIIHKKEYLEFAILVLKEMVDKTFPINEKGYEMRKGITNYYPESIVSFLENINAKELYDLKGVGEYLRIREMIVLLLFAYPAHIAISKGKEGLEEYLKDYIVPIEL